MKRLVFLFVALVALLCVIFIVACEKHKDPFSAKNVSPVISEFRFKRDSTVPNISEDSLKYRAGKVYLLHLQYRDPEFETSGRSVRATFKFLSGSGKIRHQAFTKPSADSLTFAEAPAAFDGDLLFTPDSAAIVDIELTLSDGVKESSARLSPIAKFFPNLAPIATFTATFATFAKPYQLRCDPAASRDRDGEIVESIWTFGDNSSPQSVLGTTPVTHEYQLAGQFSVRLRVIDDEGKSSSFERRVTTANQQPTAALSISCLSVNCQPGPSQGVYSGAAPMEISYNARGSVDPDGYIASYLINFGDGATALNDSGSHTYISDGVDSIKLTVIDNLGLSSTVGKRIEINTPPIARLKVTPTQGSFPLTCTIDADSSRDPFGGALTYQIFIDDQLRYTQSKVTHVFDIPKITAYLVRLQVENQRNGLRSIANEAVFVTNTPPVADFTYAPENPQATVQITFTSTSTDADPTDMITTYRWIWGDGNEDAGSTLRSATHSYNISRTYFVKLIVTDRFNGTGEKEIALEVK
jgi:PKD repeat protein